MKRNLERSESNFNVISKHKDIFQRGEEFSNATNYLINEVVSTQDIYIPAEILLEIFKCLRRVDVEKMKVVCKYWAQTAR